MGVNVIKLTEGQNPTPALRAQDLAKLNFSLHSVAQPAMSIWLMTLSAGQAAFPWWSYARNMDEDVTRLATLTGISTSQQLFDFLYLHQLKKAFPDGLYAIIPGNVKSEGWSNLNEPSRAALARGQNCLYRLEATLDKKLSVNWVPFYQPQCLVKDASGDNLNRLFNAAQTDDTANSLSFVAVDDVRKMPDVVNLLVRQDDKRSERLAQVADWFGVYSSPRDDKHGTCSMAYTTSKFAAASFALFEKQFVNIVDGVRAAMLNDPSPTTVLKIVSRLVAL